MQDGVVRTPTHAVTAAQPVVRVPSARPRRAVVMALAGWGFAYACYRAYYAAGGELGMFGRPVSVAQFRAVNAVGAAIVLAGAVLPLVLVRVAVLRPAIPVLGWLGAVGCCMHALVDSSLRVLSVTGVHPARLPAEFWLSVDQRSADLQDLFLNEPWFFVEGMLWGLLGIAVVRASRRRAWLVSAVVACLVLTAVGILSGLGVIGSFRLG